MIKDAIYHKAITDLTEIEMLYCEQLKKNPANVQLKETLIKFSGATSVLIGSYYTAYRYLEGMKEREGTINQLRSEVDSGDMKIEMLEEVNRKLLLRIEELEKQHEV